jgi:hypothetical protein
MHAARIGRGDRMVIISVLRIRKYFNAMATLLEHGVPASHVMRAVSHRTAIGVKNE